MNGYIFDLDGTLLDSMAAWDNLGADYLIAQGITPPPNFRETVKPMGFTQAAEYFITLGLDKKVPDIIKGITDMIRDQYVHHIPAKAGAHRLLEHLKERGDRLCVATATDKRLAMVALDRLEMAKYFDFVCTCEELSLNKQQSTFFKKVSDMLGMDKTHTFVVEDSLHAMRSAKEAGLSVIGLYEPYVKEDWPQIQQIADRSIRHFDELLD